MTSHLHPDDLYQLRTALGKAASDLTDESVIKVAKETFPLLSDAIKLDVAEGVLQHIHELGPLSGLIKTPGVTDVLINGPSDVWFDRGNGLERADVSWQNEFELREFAVRLAHQMHRRLDEVQPHVDVRLKNGIRLHAVIPPLAQSGTYVSLRLPQRDTQSLDDLVSKSMFDNRIKELLVQIVQRGVPFLICGGTGTGKTTLLGALLQEVPQDERVVIVEDLFELKVVHPHVLNLQARDPNIDGIGAVSMRDLVRQALRMRPDRLIIGEVRGVEIIDFFTAMNTGHRGGCATIHANSAADVPARIETLGLLAGLPVDATHNLFQCAVSVILEVGQYSKFGRRLSSLHLTELVNGRVKTIPVFDWFHGSTNHSGLEIFESLIEQD